MQDQNVRDNPYAYEQKNKVFCERIRNEKKPENLLNEQTACAKKPIRTGK